MMENKLLACPFCGEEAIMYTRRQVGYPSGDKGYEACISCWHEGCGGRVVSWALREEWAKESAITAWNTRPAPTPEALSCDGCYYRNRIEDTDFPCNKCVRCGMGDYYGEEHMNYRTKPAKDGEV